MILDIDVREFEGELCLVKFAPKNAEPVYKMDCDGYIQFSIESFSWQKVVGEDEFKRMIFKNKQTEIINKIGDL